jgi:hypothetical protein
VAGRAGFDFRMHLSERDPRKDRKSRSKGATHAILDAWPLPAQAAVPEADEPLDRSVEGDDEPITEKVPASPKRTDADHE